MLLESVNLVSIYHNVKYHKVNDKISLNLYLVNKNILKCIRFNFILFFIKS